MAKNNGGYGYPNVYNETGTGDGPDGELYFSFEEVMDMHLKATGPMDQTPNSKSGHAMMGGPAPGEPNMTNSGKEE